MTVLDWKGRPVSLTRSVGGVAAFRHPWDGVVQGDVHPWPPPELVQKLYQSRQVRAFRDGNLRLATDAHGYYCDLQSVHSEDAVTWSLFGPLAYSAPEVRASFAASLIGSIAGHAVEARPANIWLWRRLPHPERLVPGGPEIDFGVQTHSHLILGEAKWRSSVGAAQGVRQNKDQLQLRVEFLTAYGAKLFPSVQQFIVLLVSVSGTSLTEAQRGLGAGNILVIEKSWDALAAISGNPWADEFRAYIEWRRARTLGS